MEKISFKDQKSTNQHAFSDKIYFQGPYSPSTIRNCISDLVKLQRLILCFFKNFSCFKLRKIISGKGLNSCAAFDRHLKLLIFSRSRVICAIELFTQ